MSSSPTTAVRLLFGWGGENLQTINTAFDANEAVEYHYFVLSPHCTPERTFVPNVD